MESKPSIILALATLACGIATSNAALIASESFSTGATLGDYDNTKQFGDSGGNNVVLIGNSGFTAEAGKTWVTNTAIVRPFNDAPSSAGGLTHTSTVGAVAGGAVRTQRSGALQRNAARELAFAVPATSQYYLSGLVHSTGDITAEGQYITMGLSDASPGGSLASIANGFHLGFFKNATGLRLGAFAGDSSFDLGAAALDTTYMIVLGLTANAGGADSLDAWVSADGVALAQVLMGQSVETFADVGDIDTLVVQLNGQNGNAKTWTDEMRFGTEFADVALVPEPSTSALLGLIGGLGLLRRRRK